MSEITIETIRWAAARIAAHAEAVRDDLCAADAKLGDGDLGLTVAAGWKEIAAHAAAFPDDVGLAFLECAKCFQRASASSYGTLVATAFMSAAKATRGRTAVPLAEAGALLAGARDAMMARGKGSLGDKSVLDVVDAVAAAIAGLDQPGTVGATALDVATRTVVAFRDKPNRLGRARMFGARSVGIEDPGQLAALEMVRALTAAAPEPA